MHLIETHEFSDETKRSYEKEILAGLIGLQWDDRKIKVFDITGGKDGEKISSNKKRRLFGVRHGRFRKRT